MKFESVSVANLKPGETVNGIYVLKNMEQRVSSNKKPYLDLTFTDRTGDVNAKVWDVQETTLASLERFKLYYVNARVDMWNNQLQLSVNRMKQADPEDQENIADFVQAAPHDPEDMLLEVYGFASAIVNVEIRTVVLNLLDMREEKLLYYPAAKSFHHAIRSGLLWHILRMLHSARALCGVYPNVNTDLLYAGVILHDLCKMDEMDANTLGMADYNKKGKMLGHLVMGVSELDRVGAVLGTSEEVLLLLQHMVLSHHYEAEYGSPKKPLFLEAELLHHIDTIDARVYDYENATSDLAPGTFSEPVFSLDRRSLYKPMIQSPASTRTPSTEEET